jgi:tetratricopeptide (TPR) repeat protein
MSFQGDVGGIGLADLLQSLARGREGVLSLLGKDGMKATLGIQDSLVHLLPDPDEDPEMWRHRARQAWVKDPDSRIDSLRMVEIARAVRLETVYRLLDSDGVHFRFNPGPLPERPSENMSLSAGESGEERKGPRRDAVYVAGVPVEGLLLEYARLKDEGEGFKIEWPGYEDAVLVRIDTSDPPKATEKFHAECDGQSCLSEMADRLGWPSRQMRQMAIAEFSRGAVRSSTAGELVLLAQQEIGAGYADRGAARLRSWVRCAPMGPLDSLEAQIFQTEWEAGRLQPVLRSLPHADARTFLRRFDAGLGIPLAALDHWAEYAKLRRGDRIAQVRLVHLQTVASGDPNVPVVRDLLAMARAFLESERRFAAGSILRIAGSKAPEATNVRLEIGMGLIQAKLSSEAVTWIVEAATTLLEGGDTEKALPPLRALVEVEPNNREARRLLSRARAHAVQRTLVKKNSLVTIAVLLALSLGAFVQLRSQHDFEGKIEEVMSQASDPRKALTILEDQLGTDTSTRVRELRESLLEKAKQKETAERTAWTDRYRESQVECTVGDPVLGLRRALELPAPPSLMGSEDPLPLVTDLYSSLGARIARLFTDLGPQLEDTTAQIKAERKIARLIEELRGALVDVKGKQEAKDFLARLDEFSAVLAARDQKRADERAARDKSQNLAHQDRLIGEARAHANAGDYERSLQRYNQLLESDKTGKLAPLLEKEIAAVFAKDQAVKQAREMALAGRQAAAHDVLVKALKKDAADVVLPWKVMTFPAGARVRLEDGTERVTPFTLDTAWDERIRFSLELEGYEKQDLVIEHPADQSVWLSRVPERAWNRGGLVQALPVKVGDDHVVCDRNGHIARLSKGSQTVWTHDLKSLGGIGRSPVFLPKNQGHILCVSEDGEAWIVDANDGSIEGPWSNGSPPVAGPFASDSGARVRFRDGTTYEWTSRLKPEQADPTHGAAAAPGGEEEANGSNAGLAVLRRRSTSATSLESPWSGFAVDVTQSYFVVRAKDKKEPLFAIARAGDWVWVAWEGPHALMPRGRLWISDGKGLRAFAP